MSFSVVSNIFICFFPIHFEPQFIFMREVDSQDWSHGNSFKYHKLSDCSTAATHGKSLIFLRVSSNIKFLSN